MFWWIIGGDQFKGAEFPACSFFLNFWQVFMHTFLLTNLAL
jgi:hypothetical protein